MNQGPVLNWLPSDAHWRARALAWQSDPQADWAEAISLANVRLDFVQTNWLDHMVQAKYGIAGPAELATQPVRLALLGSATLAHLHAGIRVAALRRGIWVTAWECPLGHYWQALADPESPVHAFNPNAVLFSLDAHHLAYQMAWGFTAQMTDSQAATAEHEIREKLRECWRLARQAFSCQVVQQTFLPVLPALVGDNEHRLAGSGHRLVQRINADLRNMAISEGIDLLAIDTRAASDGLFAWHDPALWCRSKQDVSPAAAPSYGELAGRLLAARQGRSAKCLVLDLDDTLWGGVVGECGVEGLVLGQGSALGEGFAAVQRYAKELGKRGVILAVCSKNDEANALEPFERHPEMVLRRDDIACFVANWDDKAHNIRQISRQLNIGLDSMVFADDNPMERDLVRRELPMVAVPELPDDPALVPWCLAEAGYFEALSISAEDHARTGHYQANRARDEAKLATTDVATYLRSLDMRLTWRRFDKTGLQRVVQLINKTNQFNLTTRRYTENDIHAMSLDQRTVGLQLRLMDKFGDNGMIAVVIGRVQNFDFFIDTWLMSCRVLGRQVEQATLHLIATLARDFGANRLVGEYIETTKNGIVKDHYARLGFKQEDDDFYKNYWFLNLNDLNDLNIPSTFIITKEESAY